MATCAECVHYEACANFANMILDAFNVSEDDAQCLLKKRTGDATVCNDFADRARFVELPCMVGDKVYLDNLHIKYADVIGIYIDAFGGVFDLRIYTNIQLANGFGYEYFISKDYTFEDIGKRLFLTKESAEQALKEREENAN